MPPASGWNNVPPHGAGASAPQGRRSLGVGYACPQRASSYDTGERSQGPREGVDEQEGG